MVKGLAESTVVPVFNWMRYVNIVGQKGAHVLEILFNFENYVAGSFGLNVVSINTFMWASVSFCEIAALSVFKASN